MADTIAVDVQNLEKSFDDVHAVSDVSFTVSKGSLYSLLGPNGAGKTTTLNILSCNLLPDKGDAKIMDFSVVSQPHESTKVYRDLSPRECLV